MSGFNPWNVVTGRHGVVLQGSYDTANQILYVSVKERNFYVPCDQVWANIDTLAVTHPSFAAVSGAVHAAVSDMFERHAPPPPPRPIAYGQTWVGWSQPPRPADVVVSFDPHASRRDQARAVLYDYYHDDPLRYWSDNEAVKKCFIGGSDPRKENHDPLLLIAAYENKHHKIWSCRGDKMTWKDMNDAVQKAIAHREKLGPLPSSQYHTDPVVIYYYDNDKMKRISYPKESIPDALQALDGWWKWGRGRGDPALGTDDVHTAETDDSKKIAAERAHPGFKQPPETSWSNEGVSWDKDVAGTGVLGTITGAILAVVSAIATATGVGAVVGVPLAVSTPFIVAAVNGADTALHAGDFGAALANLGPALVAASASALAQSNVNLPPAAVKALGSTITAISKEVAQGQKKKLDFAELWAAVAKKAKSYGKMGDDEAQAIAAFVSGQNPATGHAFIQGYLAGKFLDKQALAAIAKILQSMSSFADPRSINIALLGMGLGHMHMPASPKSTLARLTHPLSRSHAHAHATHGEIMNDEREPCWDCNGGWSYAVGQDDLGAAFSDALGGLLGSGSGGGSGGSGSGGGGSGGGIGDAIGSAFGDSPSSSDTDLGAVLGTIATHVAKAAIPALAKAGTTALAQATAPKRLPAQPPAHRAAKPSLAHRGGARATLMAQINELAAKYGIPRAAPPTSHTS